MNHFAGIMTNVVKSYTSQLEYPTANFVGDQVCDAPVFLRNSHHDDLGIRNSLKLA